MGRDILVDGYNVIKNSASFASVEVRNQAAAREALITQLVSRYRHTPHRVIVVFDGDGASEQVSHDRRICIIFSRHSETADSVIARLAAEAHHAGREVEMYSNDGEVQRAVTQQGGEAHTTGQLMKQLNAPPRDVERRYRQRMAQRRRYGLDGSDPDEHQPEYRSGKSGKKRRK